MQLIFLAFVFGTIIILLTLRRPLYQAVLGGVLMTILLYRIPFMDAFGQFSDALLKWSNLSVLLSLYLITYLQRVLEARGLLKKAQQDLNGLFHNRRVNAGGAPIFIGLLPSSAAMILCGDIVKESSDGYLNAKEQAFVTSWFRHIPESTLPTYTSVLLMTSLASVPLPKFMLGMIVPMIVLYLIGYIPYLRKLPKDTGTPPSGNRLKDAVNLIKHLWTLLAILVLIVVFKFSVVAAVFCIILVSLVVYRFSLQEITKMLRSAFIPKLILNTYLVLVLKGCIAATGVLTTLPDLLSKLPIPAYLVFALMFFLGGIISGATGIIAMGTPLAFATIPESMPLMVLLMCMAHAASQISPLHVCLVVASEYYHITVGELIRKTIPCTLVFCVLMIGYYNILTLLPL